jgi:hypothetical protein
MNNSPPGVLGGIIKASSLGCPFGGFPPGSLHTVRGFWWVTFLGLPLRGL